ncbi:hypothetical protein [Alkalicoccus luteus]|uniref:Uncharacterized protein n=1 Tax=Alkalicoccus luteus TaxID=1237094 RepID=A0A969PT63_9BACI|nr:hypothetical protein [Alkalicoccus luteus]NJP39045.1 hypothetical protein [Alkalicoccus luteus]
MSIDKRNQLDHEPFRYRVTKQETVFIDYEGRQVTALKGQQAQKFLARAENTGDEKERQLLMAIATGNFKRGNE